MNLSKAKLRDLFGQSSSLSSPNSSLKRHDSTHAVPGNGQPISTDGVLSKSGAGSKRNYRESTGSPTTPNLTPPTPSNNLVAGVTTKQKKGKIGAADAKVAKGSGASLAPALSAPKKGDKLKERLAGARFRYLNEMLYTSDSKDAADSFRSDPSSFEVYHHGYRRQIDKWPVKPIELAIQYVKSKPASQVVADLGCGEALLAASVSHKVHSFDLQALNELVTVADMANLPLQDDSVNVVVFCLSLMGTNLSKFIAEAHRILADNGFMWIAEVSSRFGGDIKTFSESVESVGFKCCSCKADMSHFVTLTFRKIKSGNAETGSKTAKKGASRKKANKASKLISLAPCLYKKR